MKTKRTIIAVFLSIILFMSLFDGKTIKVKAIEQFTTSTVEIDGNTYPCYNNNDQNMPSGFQYYWAVSGRVYHGDSGNFLMLMLNKRFGLTVAENWFTNFLSYATTEMMGASARIESLFTGSVYRVTNHGSLCGIALNDLSGLPLADANTNSQEVQVVVPDQVVDTTKDILDDYLSDNPITPDIITIATRNKEQFLQNINTGNSQYQKTVEIINSPPAKILYGCGGTSQYSFQNGLFYDNRFSYVEDSVTDYMLAAASTTTFDNICNSFNLSVENNQIEYSDVISSTSMTSLTVYAKNNTTMQNINYKYVDMPSSTSTQSGEITVLNGFRNYIPYSNTESYITVYKNTQTVSNITNNVYQQTIYTSNEWTNYNISNDNSITTNNTTVNNSTTNNTSIYNNSKTEVNNNIKENNYNYDNRQIDNSVTTIINNYYGDDNGGGGDDNNDDDDDAIWKALLKAIAGFFEKIGELIATLLTGIFSIFTSILDAITSITEDFTSITSFISSFFSWLPEPITSLIVLGLGLALICAFLTWFKK